MKKANVFLTSFYPLITTMHGRRAAEKFNLPPYIDGSCRREPDFEHAKPVITGLCRPGFVNRLNEESIIIYATNKKSTVKRLLIAVLKVEKICDDHDAASLEYDKSLPNNLMTKDNPPKRIEETHKIMGWWGRDKDKKRITTLRAWDAMYHRRSNTAKRVAICRYYEGHRYHTGEAKYFLPAAFQNTGTQTPKELDVSEWRDMQGFLDAIKKAKAYPGDFFINGKYS